jgi:hypothetical protein
MPSLGRSTYLTKGEETLVIAAAALKAAAAPLVPAKKRGAAMLSLVVEALSSRWKDGHDAKPNYLSRDAQHLIRRVNARDPGREGQTKSTLTGEIGVAMACPIVVSNSQIGLCSRKS